MSFIQPAPRLSHPWDADPLVREYAERVLPPPVLAAETDTYRELAHRAATDFFDRSLEELTVEPRLVQWDPWGARIDRIHLTPLWEEAKGFSAQMGLVGAGYERRYGAFDRVHQFLMNYLVQASLDVYSCPLAMTDGAARVLTTLGNEALIERAVSRLVSRDPNRAWTSGQWMTERTGGSDVGQSESVARPADDGTWRLYGTKWFTSATTSEMSLTLARPEGNPPGGSGLALFYVETRRPDGSLNGIRLHRLKDKLGTRKVPTAELDLEGAVAVAVSGTTNGTRNIAEMLNITRTWNAVAAAWFTRRATSLALDYAKKRQAFGARLIDKPLHVDTLAALVAETEAVFHLAFRIVELRGRVEHDEASDDERALLRILTPVAKLCTGKQAVEVTSEAIESFGGAGYVHDTGLPRLLGDSQVLPIWEGTTNVLSLDLLRALAREGGLRAIGEEVRRLLDPVRDPELADARAAAEAGLALAESWLEPAFAQPSAHEHEARRFALTLGRTIELALMLRHATDLGEKGARARAVARRFARHGVDRLSMAARYDDARAVVS